MPRQHRARRSHEYKRHLHGVVIADGVKALFPQAPDCACKEIQSRVRERSRGEYGSGEQRKCAPTVDAADLELPGNLIRGMARKFGLSAARRSGYQSP